MYTTGCQVVKTYCGHGIGELFHTVPNVPHYPKNKAKGVMKPGHIFTIEPMINVGTWQVRLGARARASMVVSCFPLPIVTSSATDPFNQNKHFVVGSNYERDNHGARCVVIILTAGNAWVGF